MPEISAVKDSRAKAVRAFIAFKLPSDVMDLLQQIQSELKKEDLPIKWVRPDNIHLTLKFLGDVQPSELERIGAAMQAAVAPISPLTLCARGLGVFPSVKRPRVLWCGIGGELETLSRLHSGLDEALAELGIEKEARNFKGHLTLGRVKGKVDPDVMIEALTQYGHMVSRAFVLRRLTLYQSELKPTGPVYRELATASLQPG